MAIASFNLSFDAKACLQIAWRDRKNHKSPNCAYPEGATAGALGIELGGTNVYFGETVYKPTIGDKKREIESEDIKRTNELMYGASLAALILMSCVYLILK